MVVGLVVAICDLGFGGWFLVFSVPCSNGGGGGGGSVMFQEWCWLGVLVVGSCLVGCFGGWWMFNLGVSMVAKFWL